LLLHFSAVAQRQLDTIVRSFDVYRVQHLQEKLFVHTDKDFYTAGEIIWFKVYATDAHDNKPLDLSKLCYVELLDATHKPVLQAKIALIDAMGNGSFQLPYSVNTGTFILRAYTSWMKNEDEAYFFRKNISIVNTQRNTGWPETDPVKYDVQFFPEGGNLMRGVPNKMAFRIVNSHGESVAATVSVFNAANKPVQQAATFRFGMGHILITPEAGEAYHAVIQTSDGKTINKQLPTVQLSGIGMHLTELDSNRLSLLVESRQAGLVFTLLVHTRNLVKLALSRELFNGRTEIVIDKKDLGEGISHFTIFNSAKQPVCERLYFIQPKKMALLANTDGTTYQDRKKVTIRIDAKNAQQLPQQANLSMAVYRLDSLQQFESSDILSYLWLESDLRGHIESPAFYFTTTGKELEEAADNLVLTQGWQRFRWADVFQPALPPPAYLPETEGHLMNGKIVNKYTGLPVAGATAFLSVPGEKPVFTSDISNKEGLLQFNVKHFYGGNEIVLQTNNPLDSSNRIEIASPFSEKYFDIPVPQWRISKKLADQLVSHSIASQVGNIYLGNKQRQFLYPRAIDSSAFYGVPDDRYYLDDYTRFVTMEEVMREYVSNVRVRKNDGHFDFRVYNPAFTNYYQTAPLILLDGVPVFSADQIIAIDPLKIKRLDVVTHQFYQQKTIHDGIVSYSTYGGDLAGYQLDANALIMNYEGLQLQREFYLPVYETIEQRNSRIPDFRNLLLWEPDMVTGKDGKKTVSFYTGDVPGTYGVVLQGITKNGLSGSVTTSFKIERQDQRP
jgi:hypothetical protein